MFQSEKIGSPTRLCRLPADPVGIFAATLATVAATMVAVLVSVDERLGPVLPLVALSALAFLAERRGVRLTPTVEVSVSFLPIVFAAVLFGPLSAMAVGAAGMLTQFGQPHVRWVVWTSSRMLAGGIAGLAALAIGAPSTTAFGVLLLGAVAAAGAHVLSDIALAVATVAVRGTSSPLSLLRSQATFLVGVIPLYVPVVAGLAYVYHHLSLWGVVLFLVPAYIAQRLNVMYQEQCESALDLLAANERLEKANTSFATALVATLEARDRYTAGHSAAVAVYARDIATRMGLSPDDQRLAHLAGLVHDIGKIGLPPGMLEKAGPLRLSERREMETHSEIGERILANVDGYREIATIVRHHHERVDGMGYPDGLCGDDIPLISRVLAVADAYNAMTSDRPYRDAMPSRVARMRLAQGADTQFDTSVVAAFEAILASRAEEYRTGNASAFTMPLERREPAVAAAG